MVARKSPPVNRCLTYVHYNHRLLLCTDTNRQDFGGSRALTTPCESGGVCSSVVSSGSFESPRSSSMSQSELDEASTAGRGNSGPTWMTARVGTPQWAAPECYERRVTFQTTKIDVYSFAIVCCELVTLRPPWAHRKPDAAWRMSFEGQRPRVYMQEEQAAPSDFIALMQECWRQDPAERPSCTVIVATLREILAQIHSGERSSSNLVAMDDNYPANQTALASTTFQNFPSDSEESFGSTHVYPDIRNGIESFTNSN